jgi:hypothetical protein
MVKKISNKIDYKKYYSLTNKNIKSVLNNSRLTSHFSDVKFLDEVKKLFDLSNFLSTKGKINDKELKELLSTFNKLNNFSFKYDETFSVDNENEILDMISFLPIYVKNVFGIDLESGKVSSLNNETINNEINNDVNNENPIMSAMQGYGNIDPTAANNMLVETAARMKLAQNVNNGTVYVYKTKPKIVYIAKLVLLCSISLLMIGLLILSV